MYCLDLCRKGFQVYISVIKMVICLKNILMIQMFTIKSIKPDNMSHSITKQTKKTQDFVIVIKGLERGRVDPGLFRCAQCNQVLGGVA